MDQDGAGQDGRKRDGTEAGNTGGPRRKLGVVGGMGPLASAEFLGNLYRHHAVDPEQGAPVCLLESDPTVPDRTEALLAGRREVLRERLAAAVERLVTAGADRVVVTCFTIHRVLPDLPGPLRQRVVSLIDLAFGELERTSGRYLLLATHGTRRTRIFESHPGWAGVEDRLTWPTDEAQERLHGWVYRVKGGAPVADAWPRLREMAADHGARGVLFGCTELHLLHRQGDGAPPAGELAVLDPLMLVIRDLHDLLSP